MTYGHNLRFAIPSGSLQKRTEETLAQAGYVLPANVGRNDYYGQIGDAEWHRRDRGTIPYLIASGKFDAGITGSDLVINSEVCQSSLRVVIDLPYARKTSGATRWVLAGRENALPKQARIGTECMGRARYCLAEYLSEGHTLVKLGGTEESAVADGLCDAVFVVTETGSSLAAHKLTIIRDKLFVSTPQLLVDSQLPQDKLARVEEMGLALRAVLDGESMVTVTFDLPKCNLKNLVLPAEVSPTVNSTLDLKWIAGQILIERRQLGSVLRALNLAGARGAFMQDVQAYMKGGEAV